MSKVKNYYWDQAEKAVDLILKELKNNEISKADAKKEILESNVALDLVDINEHNIDEVIDMEMEMA